MNSAELTGSPWYFVNAYGLFGFINAKRYEMVFEALWAQGNTTVWAPLDFRCIPGSLNKVRPSRLACAQHRNHRGKQRCFSVFVTGC